MSPKGGINHDLIDTRRSDIEKLQNQRSDLPVDRKWGQNLQWR